MFSLSFSDSIHIYDDDDGDDDDDDDYDEFDDVNFLDFGQFVKRRRMYL